MECLDPMIAKRFHEGDRDALRVIAEKYQIKIFRLGYRLLGGKDAAADLTQDAFLHAWEQRGKYDPSRPFDFWFYKLALNLGRERLRRRGKEVLAAEMPELSDPPQAEKQVLEQEAQRQLHQAMQWVPQPQRECLNLRYVSEASLQEIAQILGVSLGTVKSRLHRGLKNLQKAYFTLGGA